MNNQYESDAFGLQPFSYENEEETRRSRRRPSSQHKPGGRRFRHKPDDWRRGYVKARPRCRTRYLIRQHPDPGSEYIRWVQNTLNQVMGLNLPVDGVIGVETRSAIRSFQTRQGLPADGIIGPPTEAALIAASGQRPPQVSDSTSEFEYELESFGEADSAPGAKQNWMGEQSEGRDASLAAIAEQIAAKRPMRISAMEFEKGKLVQRRTRCFKDVDVERARKTYQDNAEAARANSVDRCSCIVMLNVALGQLLKLKTKESRARSKSARKVQMAALTTETIEKALAQVRRMGFADQAITFDFFDSRKKTAGTLKPENLKESVQNTVLKLSKEKSCWYAYALSIMDGYHSVLLLVDNTENGGKIYWLDQFSTDIDDDVTTTLDQRITSKTQDYWQRVKNVRKIGSNTTVRVWPLKK